jgi:anthranilate synthase/aminodeoxychorismate synthase-like glutamine amidotransferase
MNLVQPLRARGLDVRVHRNDALTVDEALALAPSRIILSPGPNRPEQAGISVALVRAAAARAIPLLGVCLGHQAIGLAFGGRVVRARRPLHGRASAVTHDGQGVFRGLPSPFVAARYHSLCVSTRRLPRDLVPTAWADDGTLMGLRHRAAPIEGVQFHPESFLTPLGDRLLANFVAASARRPRFARPRPGL